MKGTPSHSGKISPGKTVVSPGLVKKISAGKKHPPAKRRVYQATLDKLQNLGKFTDKCHKNKENNDNVNNPVNKVIFPIIGKFMRTTDVFLPAYFPGGMVTTTTTSEVESSQHFGH